MGQIQSVTTPALDLAYEIDGHSDGIPVILVHGFPDSVRTWDAVIKELAGSGARFIRPYIRGVGATRVRDKTVTAETAALGRDVLELADALGLDQFILVGHDWGARAAYAAAIFEPARVIHLITIATGYSQSRPVKPVEPLPQARAFWYQWYFNTDLGVEALAADRNKFCRYLWETWSPSWVFTEEEFTTAARSFANEQFVAAAINYYRHRWGTVPTHERYVHDQNTIDATTEIHVPTTFVVGREDQANLAEVSLAQGPFFTKGYERIEIAEAGHFVQRENPKEVANAIRAAITAQ